jgi:hypothetical protein
VTGADNEKEIEAMISDEMAQNESTALKLYYERRCKTLGDLVLHWKGETNALYEKLAQSLDSLKNEHEKYKDNSNEELVKLKHEYDKQTNVVNKKYIEVSFSY